MAEPSGLPIIQIELARACSRLGNQRFTTELVIANCGPSATPSRVRSDSMVVNPPAPAIRAMNTPPERRADRQRTTKSEEVSDETQEQPEQP